MKSGTNSHKSSRKASLAARESEKLIRYDYGCTICTTTTKSLYLICNRDPEDIEEEPDVAIDFLCRSCWQRKDVAKLLQACRELDGVCPICLEFRLLEHPLKARRPRHRSPSTSENAQPTLDVEGKLNIDSLQDTNEDLQEALKVLEGSGTPRSQQSEGGSCKFPYAGDAVFQAQMVTSMRDLRIWFAPPANRNPLSKYLNNVGRFRRVLSSMEIQNFIADIYEKKASADEVDDSIDNLRQTLPEFVIDALEFQYGLRSIVEQRLFGIVGGIYENFEASPRLALFGYLTGILDNESWTPLGCDLLMLFLVEIYDVDVMKERLDDGDGYCFFSAKQGWYLVNQMFRNNPVWNFTHITEKKIGPPWPTKKREELYNELIRNQVPYEALIESGQHFLLAKEGALYGECVFDVDLFLWIVISAWLSEDKRLRATLNNLRGAQKIKDRLIAEAKRAQQLKMMIVRKKLIFPPSSKPQSGRMLRWEIAQLKNGVKRFGPRFGVIQSRYEWLFPRSPIQLELIWKEVEQIEEQEEKAAMNYSGWPWEDDWELGGLTLAPSQLPDGVVHGGKEDRVQCRTMEASGQQRFDKDDPCLVLRATPHPTPYAKAYWAEVGVREDGTVEGWSKILRSELLLLQANVRSSGDTTATKIQRQLIDSLLLENKRLAPTASMRVSDKGFASAWNASEAQYDMKAREAASKQLLGFKARPEQLLVRPNSFRFSKMPHANSAPGLKLQPLRRLKITSPQDPSARLNMDRHTVHVRSVMGLDTEWKKELEKPLNFRPESPRSVLMKQQRQRDEVLEQLEAITRKAQTVKRPGTSPERFHSNFSGASIDESAMKHSYSHRHLSWGRRVSSPDSQGARPITSRRGSVLAPLPSDFVLEGAEDVDEILSEISEASSSDADEREGAKSEVPVVQVRTPHGFHNKGRFTFIIAV